MKRLSILILIPLVVLALLPLSTGDNLTLSSSDQTIGFQNGSYLGFSDATVFSSHYQEPSSNASYPSYLFLQKESSNEIFGFYLSGVNVTVNSFFVNDVLELACVGSGSVLVQVGSRATPTSVSGANAVFDNALKVATVTVTASGTVQLSWAGGSGGVGGGGGSNPQPTVTPHPSTTPVVPQVTPSTKGLDLQDLDLGTVYPNGSVSVDLKFKFYGSNLSLKSISFTNPFNAWNVPLSSFTKGTYIIGADGTGSGVVQLLFQIPSDAVFMDYSGSFTVTASDAAGHLKTDTASITALVSSGNVVTDTINIFQAHPEYILIVVVAVFVVLAVIVLISRRR